MGEGCHRRTQDDRLATLGTCRATAVLLLLLELHVLLRFRLCHVLFLKAARIMFPNKTVQLSTGRLSGNEKTAQRQTSNRHDNLLLGQEVSVHKSTLQTNSIENRQLQQELLATAVLYILLTCWLQATGRLAGWGQGSNVPKSTLQTNSISSRATTIANACNCGSLHVIDLQAAGDLRDGWLGPLVDCPQVDVAHQLNLNTGNYNSKCLQLQGSTCDWLAGCRRLAGWLAGAQSRLSTS